MAVAEELRPGIAARLTGSPSLRLAGRRLLAAIPVLLGVTFLTYVVMNLLPGDAAQELLGANATPAEVRQLEIQLHLNEPFWVRYGHWLGGVLHGNLGTSVANGENVTTILGARLPVTAELLAYAFVWSVVLAIAVAILAARKPNGVADRVSMVVSMTGLSVAPYVLALVLIYLFAVRVQWFPAIGYTSLSADPVQNIRSLTLPAIALGFALFSVYTRLLRADIIEQMQREDYIVTARAKGVPPWRILLRHAVPNSMFGLITLIGLNLGALVGAVAIIEPIFSLPGVGAILIQSIDRPRRARRRGNRRRLRRGRGGRQPALRTCCTRPWTRGSGMSAPLPDLLAPGAAIAPAAVRSRARGGWTRGLRLWLPAGFLILMLGACFIWPQHLPGAQPGARQRPAGRPAAAVARARLRHRPGWQRRVLPHPVRRPGLVRGRLRRHRHRAGRRQPARGHRRVPGAATADATISRVLDVLIAFPALVLALVIAEGLGPSEVHVIWALTVFSIPAFGRIARGATIALREQTFMLAARLSGTRGWRMIVRHIVPNIAPQLLTFSLLGFGVVIILEGALSFLGLGIPLPEASWGSMIAQGQQTLSASPDLVLIPSAFLFATVLSLNLLGDALRERWAI